MKKFMLVALTMILALSAFNLPSVLAAPAEPPVPVPLRSVDTVLSGPAIDGVVPTAKAEFRSLQGQTSLGVAASNLNLPDFTVLTVALNGTAVFQMTVLGGKATRMVSPSPEAIHPGDLITVAIGNAGGVITQAPTPGTIILSGTF
jgi:hypothetical protein